jgi:hypothetical protein
MKDRESEVIDRPTGPGETISEWMDDEGDVIREVTTEGPEGPCAKISTNV